MADISDVNVREISDLYQQLESLSCTAASFPSGLDETDRYQLELSQECFIDYYAHMDSPHFSRFFIPLNPYVHCV